MKKEKVTINCVGKQQPSKEALDRFIDTYIKMVKSNKEKAESRKED